MCDMHGFALIEQKENQHESIGKSFGVSSSVGVGGKSGGKGCSDRFVENRELLVSEVSLDSED